MNHRLRSGLLVALRSLPIGSPRRAMLVLATAAALFAGRAPANALAFGAPLRTGVMLGGPTTGTDDLQMARIRAAGASVVRIIVAWRDIAPVSRALATEKVCPSDHREESAFQSHKNTGRPKAARLVLS